MDVADVFEFAATLALVPCAAEINGHCATSYRSVPLARIVTIHKKLDKLFLLKLVDFRPVLKMDI